MPHSVSRDTLAALAGLDSCSVANAIECFDVRLRNEGFTDGTILCRLPSLPSMVGHAMTIRIRAASPSWKGDNYLGRNDWWTKLQFGPAPQVLVIQDMDRQAGTGAFIGEVHAAILQAMGCVGAITNGAVRGLPGVERLGFRLFSGSVSVSHAYIHVIEVGGVVEIGGLRVAPGDLIHGDVHGVVRVPLNIANEIPAVAGKIREQERRVVQYCQLPEFNIGQLRSVVANNPGGVSSEDVGKISATSQHL
jgi:4-hydroxy-4-methyl-2-oxoglutarate aldolase